MRTDKGINAIISEFIADCNVNERSRKNYRETLKLFVLWMVKTNRDVRNVKRSDIITYKDSLISEGKSAYTIDNYLASIRQFFKYTCLKDYHDDIAYGIQSPRRERRFRKNPLTGQQVIDLLSLCDDSINGRRDYAMILLMVSTGLRRIEVSRVNIGDIQHESGSYVLYIQRKGQTEKRSMVALIDNAIDAINEYLCMRVTPNNDEPLFVYHGFKSTDKRIHPDKVNAIVKSYMIQINLLGRKYTAHSLRHTAACLTLEAGATPKEVQSLLGHSNVMITEVYSGMITERLNLINPPANRIKEVFLNASKQRNNAIKTHSQQNTKHIKI